MLGWSPQHFPQNRTSPGRRCPPQNHETARLHSFSHEKPVLQPPHKIVIGFDLGISNDKSLNHQASESPRSVLDSDRPQSTSPRSPLSALGSLLTGATCVSSTDPETNTAASNVSAARAVLGIEHSSCAVGRIGSDLLAVFRYSTHSSSRASKDQRNEKHRERYMHRRCNSILSSDGESDCTEDDVETSKSLFSTGPLCLDQSPQMDRGMDFLSKCFRCKRQLLEGKDIYMYRSDQAFCSQECRYHHIVTGERKHGNPVVTPCISRIPHGSGILARAIEPTFA